MTIGEEILVLLKKEILQDESVQIETDEDLLTTGLLNSMALIRLVAAIETSYKIKIPPTDLVIENFINVNSMESYITKNLSA